MSKLVQLQPYDQHNQELESNVHPTDWKNPKPTMPYHLVVIGGGTAGLVTAAGAAGLGARVALVERELLGGDCLNVGCVPSKGLISAARVAARFNSGAQFGVADGGPVRVDFAKTMERMRRLRAQISPADSAKRFSELGVDVFFGNGSFESNQSVKVTRADGSHDSLEFKKAVIASGARASAPPIPGLENVKYLTNENLFSLTELPEVFGIIGAGPIGSEMAQSFARFGSQVHLFEMSNRILAREDADAAAILEKRFRSEGINILTHSTDQMIASTDDGKIRVTGRSQEEPYDIVVDQLLVAVGRAPNTNGLDLQKVNVTHDRTGIAVNDFMQTTNPNIYAAGDICSQFKFTHSADFQARIVIQNALFAIGPFGKKKASDLVIPWATYTSPEVAHVGTYEQNAAEAGIEIDTYLQTFEHIDRAILENADGFVKIHVRKGTDKIVGATIVAENAGDMISEIVVAMTNKIGLAGIGKSIHPYPTQAEAIRKLGDQFNRTKLTSFSKKILGLLMKLNVGR